MSTTTTQKETWNDPPIAPGVKKSSKGRYRVTAWARSHKTGKKAKKEKILSADHTLMDATTMHEQMVAQIRGVLVSTAEPVTSGAYLIDWLRRHKEDFSPATYDTYREHCKHYLMWGGDIYCHAFTRRDMEDFSRYVGRQTRKRDGKPLAQATMDSIWRHNVNWIKDMAADHHIADPTIRVKKPKSPRSGVREGRVYTPQQVMDLVEAGWRVNSYLRALMSEIVCLVGMRPGEVAALTPDALEREIVLIKAAVSKGVWRPRTKNGQNRRGYLPQSTMDKVHIYRKMCIAEQHPGLSSGLIFTNRYGEPFKGVFLGDALARASEEAGLPFRATAQVLRRTWNTNYFRAGIDRLVMRDQIGHADEAMTECYLSGEALDDEKKVAHERVFHNARCS